MKWYFIIAALIYLGLGVVGPDEARAQGGGACAANGCDGIVTDLYINTNGVYLRTNLDETTLNCQLLAGYYIVLENSHVNFDAIYSALLTHYMAERKIFIRINDGSSGCTVQYVRAQK